MNAITACKKLKFSKLKLSLGFSGVAKDNLDNLPFLDKIANNCLLQNVKYSIIAHLIIPINRNQTA